MKYTYKIVGGTVEVSPEQFAQLKDIEIKADPELVCKLLKIEEEDIDPYYMLLPIKGFKVINKE